MPDSPKNKKKKEPPARKSRSGCMHCGSITIEDGVNIGKFRMCASEDSESLQIWKEGKLIKTFKNKIVGVMYMSYSDYLRKLQFGNVSQSVDALKQHELSSLTNPLDKRILSLDNNITICGVLGTDIPCKRGDVTTGLNSLGGTVEGIATMKKLYSKFKDFKDKATELKNKLKGKKDDESPEEEEGGEEGEFDPETVELPEIEGADLPAPEMAPPGQSFSEEPSEFMDALQNDDFSSLRRMLGMEQKEAEPEDVDAGDSGFQVPDQLPTVEGGGEVAPAPPPDLRAPPAEPVGEEVMIPEPKYGDLPTIREGEEAEEPEGAYDDLPDWADNLNLPGTKGSVPEYTTRSGAYDGARPTSNYDNQRGELTDSTNELTDGADAADSGFGARPISGRAVGSQYDNQQNPSNAPDDVEYEEQTLPDEMMHAGGDTEMDTFGSNNTMDLTDTGTDPTFEQPSTLSDVGNSPPSMQAEAPTIAESDPEAGRTLADSLDLDSVKGQLGDTEDTVSSLTSKIGSIGEDVAGDTADVAADATAEGLEISGAGLDASGTGAIVGIGLQIAGAAVAIGTTISDSTDNPDSDESKLEDDEKQVDNLKSQELSDQAKIASEQFVGASIVPDMSSTTLQNVTSGAL